MLGSAVPFSIWSASSDIEVSAVTSADSGTCGENLNWVYSDGILRISGTGAMSEYGIYSNYPWYDYRHSITQVIVEEGVTSIGDNSFRNSPVLTSAVLSSSVASIGECAFGDCDKLVSVEADTDNPHYASIDGILFDKKQNTLLIYPAGKTAKTYTIPNGVTAVGDYAFYSCDKLKSVTLPSSVKEIGSCAFRICESLITVNASEGLTSIADYAFAGCSYLTAFDTPDTVTDIGPYAFSSCTMLKSVTLPDSLTNIGEFAFYSCDSLDNIQIPDSITSLNDGVFGWCDSLTSVIIPENVTSIGYYAFGSCQALTSIVIFGDVESIGEYAFGGCSSLAWIAINNPDCSIYDSEETIYSNAVIYGHEGSTTQSYAEQYGRRFYELVSATCGDGVTWILAENGVMTISGAGAIKDYYWDLPDDALWNENEDNVTEINIENGITAIGAFAFKDFANLSYISIPDSVTSISEYAFCGCKSLPFITIPESVTSIGDYAFGRCERLGSVTIENPDCEIYDSEDTIYSGAVIYGYEGSTAESYAEKYGREFVTLGKGSCGKNLTWKYLDGVLTISGTGAMTDFSNASEQPWYRYRDRITEVIIGEGVTSIGYCAFRYCDKITSVTIPESMKSIGTWGFGNCYSLSSVIIPESVESIDIVAFENCYSLDSVTIYNSNCEIYDHRNTIPSDIIYGYEGSTAQSYAEKYGNTFLSVDSIPVRGDVNADGALTIADVVALQKWLLCTPNATLADWKAADLCEDDRLDVFDLCLMKRELLNVIYFRQSYSVLHNNICVLHQTDSDDYLVAYDIKNNSVTKMTDYYAKRTNWDSYTKDTCFNGFINDRILIPLTGDDGKNYKKRNY